MQKKICATIILSLCISLVFAQKWTSALVQVDKSGHLVYKQDSLGNRIPDFSNVGYLLNRKSIPVIPVIKVVSPSDSNSQQLIQKAIDEVAAMPLQENGFRGAILLKKGTYRIPGTIKISTSGIVLRGEGEETILIATGKGQRNLISATGTGSIQEIKGTSQNITDAYVPVGSKQFNIASVAGLHKGDSIIVFRPGTQQWIHDLKMDEIEMRDSTVKQWVPSEYNLQFERVITNINGNAISIDNPVVMAMEEKYGGGKIYRYTFKGRIQNIGVENLTCVSEYKGDTDEDHGWNAVFFNRVEQGWVRHVTARYFGYSCVNLGGQAKNITVDSCRYVEPKSQVTGGRRYSFNNDGQQNLVMHCFASEGRHDYVTGAKVCGPNVFYDCRSVNAKADIGPHHRWAMGTLFDNIVTDGEMNAQDRGNWGTGHGWAGVNQVFWNCTAKTAAIQNPWVSGKNYVIGMKGQQVTGRLKGRPATEWEGKNKPGLQPRSLYEAQLAESILLN